MSRNKMYDEILVNLKNDFATVDFANYGLSDNEKIYTNICDEIWRLKWILKLDIR